MANYHDAYHAFGMPFLFEDQEHFYRAMNSPEMRDFFLETEEDGFVSLTYYTSGQRSFYTSDTAVQSPEDLSGLNLRVQDMRSQTDMVSAMGGTPVAMAYGDVYTSLQTGMLDGTENNETALTDGFHGEVAKVYSYTEHAIIPDVFVMSEDAWNQLSGEDQEIFIEAAIESTELHHDLWDEAVEESVQIAEEEMGVEFIEDVDREAFREATAHIIEEYSDEYEEVRKLVELIQSID
jgi:TRAP-type C4-dicarboxylate transport system substrate-binding protein